MEQAVHPLFHSPLLWAVRCCFQFVRAFPLRLHFSVHMSGLTKYHQKEALLISLRVGFDAALPEMQEGGRNSLCRNIRSFAKSNFRRIVADAIEWEILSYYLLASFLRENERIRVVVLCVCSKVSLRKVVMLIQNSQVTFEYGKAGRQRKLVQCCP